MKRTVFVIGMILILLALSRSVFAQTTSVWRGEYFSNRNLQGAPVFTRDDATIDFAWGANSPGANVPADNFSVRWTRWYFIDTPGNWTFTTITDDGVRLFIDDAMVIDAWNDQTLTTRSVAVSLSQSFHLVRMEYYEKNADAQAHLFITSANYPDWRGEYYSNPTFAGTPAFVRNDSAINFSFGSGGPGGGIPGENFSARWTRNQYFNAGRYRFTTNTDDGVRLWVDGQLLIDQWKDQTLKSWTAETTLAEGNHWLRLDYFQRTGSATAMLTWTAIQGTGEVWRGEYYASSNLEGTPVLTRDDMEIDFDWGAESPGRGIAKNSAWSARWTSKREIILPGFFTAIGIGDDGFRIYVDNNLLIDEWHDQPPTPHAAMIYLNAGAHDWRVEFYQHTGTASMRVNIARGAIEPDQLPQTQIGLPVSEIIVDTKSAGFIRNADNTWQSVSNGLGGLAYTATNNTFAQSIEQWARWYPSLINPGEYEILAHIPANLATTRSARYTIVHAGTFDMPVVNQSLYTNQWVSLGNYYFAATGDEHVLLSDVTYEPALNTTVVADVLKFVPR